MPKLYFYDTGLACNLLGIERASQIETHYLQGALFENLIILELLKGRLNRGRPPNLYFWRDRTGHEVDCISEWGGKTHAIEIKAGKTFKKSFIKELDYFSKLTDGVERYLIYNGSNGGKFLQTNLVSTKDIDQLFKELGQEIRS